MKIIHHGDTEDTVFFPRSFLRDLRASVVIYIASC
jgi:hypothetical protein